jgi:predicted PurR-regulated permease PerM
MLQKIKGKTSQLTKKRHNQFANFKAKVKQSWYAKFPVPHKEIDDKHLQRETSSDTTQQQTFSTQKIITFRAGGLLFAAIGFLVYNTLDYLYLLIAACIISLALEGIISFWARLTHSRGVGIIIAYLLFILFLISGFIIIVPFLMSWGTQLLQSITIQLQAIQADILTQGIDAYIRGIKRIPNFLNEEILKYIQKTNSASIIQTVTENLGNIVNLSSLYLKTLGNYAVNIFGSIFSVAGKLVIFFTLSIFFSISHFEVKYIIKYLFRRLPQSKQKVDEVYQ